MAVNTSQVSTEVAGVPDGGAAMVRAPWWQSVVRESSLLAVGGLLYTLVRGLTDDRMDVALSNAERVIAFERSLGLYVEPGMQRAVVGMPWAVDVANAIYIAYWPIIFGALVWLLVARRAYFALYRSTFLISGLLALAVFTLFPLAPPRFLGSEGFVDTIAAESDAYRSFNASAFVNEYAAMPSMHFGWVLLVGIAITTLARHPLARAAGAVLPVVMLAAIVLTANHFIVDGLVGGVLVLIAFAAAHWLRTRFAAPRRELW